MCAPLLGLRDGRRLGTTIILYWFTNVFVRECACAFTIVMLQSFYWKFSVIMGTSRFLRNLEGKKLIGGVCASCYYSTHNEWRASYKWRAILDIRPRDGCRTVIYQITCRAVCGGNDSLTGVFVATFLRVTNDVQKWVLPTTNRTILFLCDKSYSAGIVYIRTLLYRHTMYAFRCESKNFDGVSLLRSASGTNRSNRTVNMYKATPLDHVEYFVTAADNNRRSNSRVDVKCQQWQH